MSALPTGSNWLTFFHYKARLLTDRETHIKSRQKHKKTGTLTDR